MRPSPVVLAGLLLASACDDDPAATCVDGPRRVLAGAPEALTIALPTLAADHVVVAAGVPATVDVVPACGGEPVRLAGPELGLAGAFALASDDGPIALGQRPQTGELLLLDRLDEPGVDEPRVVATLDPAASGWFRWPRGMLLWSGPLTAPEPGPSRIFGYPGPEGPTAPAVPLADGVVWLGRAAPDAFLALTADGTLLTSTIATTTVAATRVRRADLAPDGAQFVWQALGSSSMALRDVEGGRDVPLVPATRSAGQPAAGWRWTDAAIAVVSPTGVLTAAHDRRTGAHLATPPPHLLARDAVPGELLLLTTALTPERVELAWDPHTDLAFAWYRGPDVALHPISTADGVRWLDLESGALWQRRPDAAPELLQAHASLDATVLLDGRTIMRLPTSHPRGALADTLGDLVLLAADGRTATALADSVARWTVVPDDPPRLVHATPDGPDAGVWVTPL